MTRRTPLLMLLLAGLTTACPEASETDPASAPPPSASSSAPAEEEASAIPVPADFEEAAEAAIDEDNYQEALDDLAEEIESN